MSYAEGKILLRDGSLGKVIKSGLGFAYIEREDGRKSKIMVCNVEGEWLQIHPQMEIPIEDWEQI